jgi:hypothetical protein
MVLTSKPEYTEPEGSQDRELAHLYKRLSTVTNLIRSLEEYDRIRPRPARLNITEKSA